VGIFSKIRRRIGAFAGHLEDVGFFRDINDSSLADDVFEVLYGPDGGGDVRMNVPAHLLTTKGAFRISGGWNPLTAALHEGREVLEDFYRYGPRTTSELLQIDAGVLDENAVSATPWTARKVRPSGGRAYDELRALEDPRLVSEHVDREMVRLNTILSSVEKSGFRPDLYGPITGYFLQDRDDFRFVVRGGKHRASVLAALGHEHIPVSFKPKWPRLINPQITEWPAVREGALPATTAATILRRYFDFDGTQQRSWMNDNRQALRSAASRV
jgi:hypothetical protein